MPYVRQNGRSRVPPRSHQASRLRSRSAQHRLRQGCCCAEWQSASRSPDGRNGSPDRPERRSRPWPIPSAALAVRLRPRRRRKPTRSGTPAANSRPAKVTPRRRKSGIDGTSQADCRRLRAGASARRATDAAYPGLDLPDLLTCRAACGASTDQEPRSANCHPEAAQAGGRLPDKLLPRRQDHDGNDLYQAFRRSGYPTGGSHQG